MVVHAWGLFDQRIGINQILDNTRVLCFAAKWHDQSKVLFYSEHHDGRKKMVAEAHKLIDEADAIIHYNGNSFDIPHLRREFIEAGLRPPSPHKNIDLLQVVKKQFRFPSNKLDYVAQSLGLSGKVAHTGHQLWVDCMAGDAKAWALMKKYNVGDVKLTEELYERLLPWITSHPHTGLYNGKAQCCANCGGTKFQRRGTYKTALGAYQRYQCLGCGKWSHDGVRTDAVKMRGIQ